MKKKTLLLVLLAALLVLALWRLDFDRLLYSIAKLPLWLVFTLLGLQIVSQLLLNLQWWLAARCSNAALSFPTMLYINCQGAMVDAVTPGVKVGGEIARAVQISRLGHCSGEQAGAVVAMQKLFSLSAFFLIQLLTIGFLFRHTAALGSPLLQGGIYGVLLLALALFAGTVLAPHRLQTRLQRRAPSRFKWARRVRRFFLTLLGQVIVLRGNKKALTGLFALSVLIWLLYPAKLYLLMLHLPHTISVYQLTAVVFAAYMVAMVPLFPGGLVGFEGTMSGLLLTLGVALTDAAVVTVLFRFFTFWLVLLLGLGFAAVYKALHKNPTAITEVRVHEKR